jgi:uncharacterized Ntn-hydrolase superfamily protein
MIFPSTFSIVAYDPSLNAWGIAVASKFLAVGAVVPWARAGAGVVATQSYANTSYGPRGLDLMEAGHSASEALQKLLENDPQPELRQLGLVDAKGETATYTGSACFSWAGGVTGSGFAVQGNILASEQVVQTMASTYAKNGHLHFISRLYQALRAGDQAGGDRRGRQSAAMMVVKPHGGYGGHNDRWVDYRVDDSPDPLTKLSELLELHDLYFGSSPPSDQVKLVGKDLQTIQSMMKNLGYYHGPIHGRFDTKTRSAFEEFIGNENFEDRTNTQDGWIDRPVMEYLLRRFG